MADSTQTMFSVWVTQANDAYDALVGDIRSEVIRMRALGISDEEIFKRLTISINGKYDMFAKFSGGMEGSQDSLFNTLAQISSNEEIRQDGALYEWQLDPTAQEHCIDCLRNSKEKPMLFDEWIDIGLPGAGNTLCDGYCKCTLMIVKE